MIGWGESEEQMLGGLETHMDEKPVCVCKPVNL